MKFCARLLSLLLILSLLAGNIHIFALQPMELSAPEASTPGETVRVIVLLEDQPEAQPGETGFKAEQRAMARSRSSTRASMEQTLPELEVEQEFSVLLSGFSVDIPSGELDTLRQLPGVSKVWIAQTYEAPVLTAEDSSNLSQAAATVPEYTGEGTLIAILDTGINLSHEAFAVYPEVLEETALSEEEAAAAGTSVSGTYVSEKIPFAYDYAENDGDVTDHNGHGTHVSGIAAGYAPERFSGEAPGAQLAIMKIFRDHSGTTSSDLYFKALEDAFLLGADVISMSLGTPCGFTHDDSLEGEVFGNIYDRLEEAGIILCAAGGNSGSQADHNTNLPGTVTSDYADYGTVASPGTYEGNISVAAASKDDGTIMKDSSRGTTPELTIAPAVSATGENVISAARSGNDQYRTSTGTSMAAPAVAGQLAAVLSGLKEQEPDMDKFAQAKTAEALLLGSAEILGSDTTPVSVRSQGAGLSDSAAALGLSSFLSEPLMELGDDPAETGVYEMTLRLEPTPGWEGACPMSRFSDVDMEAWYHDAVDYTVAEGLFRGTSDTTFDPAGVLTRGQAVTVLHRLAGSPAPSTESPFTDVEKGAYYETAAAWAREVGVVKGVTETTFCPDDPVTREQLVTMLHRYLGNPRGNGDLSSFVDNTRVSDFARDAMGWAVGAGIINGYTDNTLQPQAETLRAQLAAILYRQIGGTSGAASYETFFAVCGDSVETDENGVTVNTLTSRLLDCTVEFSCGDTLTLNHGEESTVFVTITLSPEEKTYLRENFPNGTFVEGYVGFRNDGEAVHATFLSFFGDWEKASILEQYDFRDVEEAEDQNPDADPAHVLPMNTAPNMAYLYCGNSASPFYGSTLAILGDNPFADTEFEACHMALSPGLSGEETTVATELLLRPVQLRNARSLTLTVTDRDSGEIYYQDTKTYLSKSSYNRGLGGWGYSTGFRWTPTASDGTALPHGTALTVTLSASLGGEPETPQWSFPCVVDAMAPELSYVLQEGILTVTARDEGYLSCLCVSDEAGETLSQIGYSDTEPGMEHTLSVDVSGLSGTILVEAGDYATNVTAEKVELQ